MQSALGVLLIRSRVSICLAIGLCFVVCGCGDTTSAYPWGEASRELAEDWCQARERCLSFGELDICVRHNMHHLCELHQLCDIAVPEAEAMVSVCIDQLQAIDGPEHEDCFLVAHGVIPEACTDLLDLMPEGR